MQHISDTLPASPLKKMNSFQTLDDLRREAALGKQEDFAEFLKLVPDVPPLAGDEFSSDTDIWRVKGL